MPAKWRAVIEATKDESRPPDSRTPKGTSVINLLITACILQPRRTMKQFSDQLVYELKGLGSMKLTFSKARLRTRGSYGADGIASENQGGLYHLLNPPSLLEYMWPGGKLSKCSQSSFKPLSSDEIHTEPEDENWQ